MRITLMTPDQRAHFTGWLAGQNPAAPELLAAAVADAKGGGGIGVNATAADMLAIVARLVEAEQQLATTRDTLARVLAAMEEGDYYSPDDVMHEFDQAGISIRADVQAAGDAADSEAAAGALR